MPRMKGTQEYTIPTIALLTDFGLSDGYVGAMKGVIWSICPSAHVIDISHDIAPQSIQQAAYVLQSTYRYMPQKTVFCAVVDPGVGSSRKPVAIQAGHYTFVGPDNGIFSYVLDQITPEKVIALENEKYHLANISATFHGRDIFSPSAAHIASGVDIEKMGSLQTKLERLTPPYLHVNSTALHGEVLYIDHFGNCITSIGKLVWDVDDMLHFRQAFSTTTDGDVLPAFGVEACSVEINEIWLEPLSLNYVSASPGKPIALINSAGQLEIAVSQGNAARQLGIQIGDRVSLHFD